MSKSYVGMNHCFICLEPAEILLDLRMKDSFKSGKTIYYLEPCDKCKENMKLGITVVRTETGKDFTGTFVVIKEDAKLIQDIKEPMRSEVIKKRIMFMEPDMFDQLFKQE